MKKLYSFEFDTTGKCEVVVEACNDEEAIEKLIKKDFVAKSQLKSNLEMPSLSMEYVEEAMEHCLEVNPILKSKNDDREEQRILSKELG